MRDQQNGDQQKKEEKSAENWVSKEPGHDEPDDPLRCIAQLGDFNGARSDWHTAPRDSQPPLRPTVNRVPLV